MVEGLEFRALGLGLRGLGLRVQALGCSAGVGASTISSAKPFA